ncbi:MAG: hypothetical protein EOP62_00080 [Sphingomonadales bacterium]|nr:MAG: hypothetical protein EOP62_00080 [Sphingomonadales bacterium]
MKFKLMGGIAAVALAIGAPGAAAAQDAHARPALQLATNGLELRDVESKESDLIGFGTSQDDTVAFIGRALNGPTASGLSEECGAGPLGTVDFDDVRLYFKAGEFVGWETTSGHYSKQGIHVGMTSDELMAATDEMEGEENSIGYEWTADGFSGLLTEGGPKGVITTIWAGTTCIMR